MSISSSIPPSMKISTSCSSSSTSSSFKFPVIRCSKAEGPLRRPVAPPLREPSSSPLKPVLPSNPVSVTGLSQISSQNVITFEFQRKMAKELQEYFRKKKLEEANQGPFFGFIPKNEISNGRWAMFGFAVGLLTEYATGSDFVDQLKILLSNFGIVDLD